MKASAAYCADSEGYGRDCGQVDGTSNYEPTNAVADVSALYPSVMGGVGLSVGRHFRGPFHGLRLFALVGAGQMPHVRAGVDVGRTGWTSIGLGLEAAMGSAADSSEDP